ncbi:MAG: hypothetical protein KKB34_04250 [Bacteroidetes bacterium]|nr:hypothetical protein [Bacteroidota bacterium]
MKTEEIIKMIDEYFDGELEKGKEPILFTQLSLNDESREYFKAANKIKSIIGETIEEFPEELEARILYSAASKESRWFNLNFSGNFPALLSYAATVILLIVTFFLYSESINYKNSLEVKIQQVNDKNQMIELLFNCLPQAEVKGSLENPVIIKSKS